MFIKSSPYPAKFIFETNHLLKCPIQLPVIIFAAVCIWREDVFMSQPSTSPTTNPPLPPPQEIMIPTRADMLTSPNRCASNMPLTSSPSFRFCYLCLRQQTSCCPFLLILLLSPPPTTKVPCFFFPHLPSFLFTPSHSSSGPIFWMEGR